MPIRHTYLVFSLWAFLGQYSLYAQLTRGYLSGTVQDSSGAAVTGAEVKITNRDTGIVVSLETNGEGVYRFVAVETGMYDVEIFKQGFTGRRVERVEVSGAGESVLNQTLDVAMTTASVDVREAPPGVELAKASASLGRTVDGRLVEALPVTGRDAVNLVLLAPMVVIGQGGNSSSTGQRNYKNNYMLDGLSHNNTGIAALFAATPLLPEAVGEFQVQTNAYSAEYGRNTGAQLSVVTRSGTNEWHGSAWDYFGSHLLSGSSLPDKRNGLDKTRLVSHEAGANLGGPAVKNRTFVFGIFQNTSRRPGLSTREAADITIPTEQGFAMLPRVPRAAGQTVESRQSMLAALDFLRGIYPQVRGYSSVATQNINGLAVPVGTTRVPIVRTNDVRYWQGRLDHRAGSRDTFTFTTLGYLDTSPFSPAGTATNLGFGELFAETQRFFVQKHAVSHTRTISSQTVTESRFGLTQLQADSDMTSSAPAVVVAQSFTIGRHQNAPLDIFPPYKSYEWQNVTTRLAGRHSLKVGLDVAMTDRYERSENDVRGRWNFDNLTAFLNNQATTYTRVSDAAPFTARAVHQSYFVQDDFRIRKDLTLTAGVRYERWNVPFGYFGATLPEVLAAGVAPPPKPDGNNWAPRGGFAYSPDGRGALRKIFGEGQTVFRGGYGIGYDLIQAPFAGRSNYPRAISTTINRPETVNLFPTTPQARPGVFNPLANVTNVDPDLQLPTVHFYSFSIQRQFARHYGVVPEFETRD